MRELVGLFQEPGSIDELGLGRIRDAFSDRLFPGTSVLWRRARYLLFVPWVYAEIEAHGFQRHANAELAARALQRKLRDVLASTRDTDGVIGLRQADPNSPPDVILWAALEQWGLREPGGGSLAQYQGTLQRRPLARGGRDEPGERYTSWTDRLVSAPDSFPDAASFRLRGPEARLLWDLTLQEDAEQDSPGARRRDSMMASLLRSGTVTDAPSPWLHPLDAAASDELRLAVHMSGCFSDVMHGARLAYALRLAQLRKLTDYAAELDQEVAAWASRITSERPEDLRAWAADLPAFWRIVRGLNDRISLGSRPSSNPGARWRYVTPHALRHRLTRCA